MRFRPFRKTPAVWALAASLGALCAAGGVTYAAAQNKPNSSGPDKSFQIASDPVTGLYPGRTVPLRLRITNPFNFDIYVTELGVRVKSVSRPACVPSQNTAITPYSPAAYPIRVPARTTLTLPSPATTGPKFTLLDTTFNQNACRNATFTLTYDGEATKK